METVRSDLADQFQRIHRESDQRMDQESGAIVAAAFRETFAKYEVLMTRLYAAEALGTFARDPSPEDIVLARRHLSDFLARLSAVAIIASKGGLTEVPDLIEIAQSGYGDERRLALKGLERLATGRFDAVKELLASETHQLRRTGLQLIRSLGDHDAVRLLEDLLSDKDENIRVGAVAQLHERLDGGNLVDILGRYTERDSYYYNVVFWLDRLIYAPAPVLRFYEAELRWKVSKLFA